MPKSTEKPTNPSRRRFLKGMISAGGMAALVSAGVLPFPSEAKAAADLHTKATFQALVDAVVPSTPELAGKLGPEHVFGGLDLKVDEFLIWSFDHYLAVDGMLEGGALSLGGLLNTITRTLNGSDDLFVPLAAPTAALLDVAATQLIATGGAKDPKNPLAFPGGGPFASLSRSDRFRAITLLEKDAIAVDLLPDIYRNTVGLVQFIAGALVEFTAFGYYSEWPGYGSTRTETPEKRIVESRPLAWTQVDYPGPAHGYTDFRGFEVTTFTE